jgi:hypothetical protein
MPPIDVGPKTQSRGRGPTAALKNGRKYADCLVLSKEGVKRLFHKVPAASDTKTGDIWSLSCGGRRD